MTHGLGDRMAVTSALAPPDCWPRFNDYSYRRPATLGGGIGKAPNQQCPIVSGLPRIP
jgi:hypothetical protein